MHLMPLQAQLLLALQWRVVDSMRTLIWTLKGAQINDSTAHKEKYEHWWQERCTAQKHCGINVIFFICLSSLFCCQSAPEHLHVKLSKMYSGGGNAPDPPPPLLLTELCHLFDLLWVCRYASHTCRWGLGFSSSLEMTLKLSPRQNWPAGGLSLFTNDAKSAKRDDILNRYELWTNMTKPHRQYLVFFTAHQQNTLMLILHHSSSLLKQICS